MLSKLENSRVRVWADLSYRFTWLLGVLCHSIGVHRYFVSFLMGYFIGDGFIFNS